MTEAPLLLEAKGLSLEYEDGSRHVLAVAAAAQSLAMIYAAAVTFRHLARSHVPAYGQ